MKCIIKIEIEGDESSDQLEHNSIMIANLIEKALEGKTKTPFGVVNEFTSAYYRDLTIEGRFENLIIIKKLYRLKDQSQFFQDSNRGRSFSDHGP